MKIFISWSGGKSRQVALALHEWLPYVINSVEPFVSSQDIYAGNRWQVAIADELEASNYGIVCVTRANQTAPWLNFEAGALAKAVSASQVVPLAVDLKTSDIEQPMGQFQAKAADETGIGEMLKSINSANSTPLETARLEKSFDKWWPELQDQLAAIERSSTIEPGTTVAAGRTDRALLEEILDTIRGVAQDATAEWRPPSHEHERSRFSKGLRALLRSVPIRSWEVSYSTPGYVEVTTPEAIPAEVQADIARLARGTGARVLFRVGEVGEGTEAQDGHT